MHEYRFAEDQPRVPAGEPGGGQWTSGDGGAPSGWTHLTDAEAILSAPNAISARLADREEHYVGPGGLRVSFAKDAKIPDKKKEQVMRTAAALRERYGRPVSVAVTSTKVGNFFGTRTYGATMVGSRAMILTPKGCQASGKSFRQGVAEGFYMAAGKGVDVTDYAMIHEVGHGLDHRVRDPETQRALDTIPAGSGYGRTKKDEAFAESFAEWHLSGGKTSDPLTKALAVSEHWR